MVHLSVQGRHPANLLTTQELFVGYSTPLAAYKVIYLQEL